MRLLFVVHQFFPDCKSGTEQYCLAMARAARASGDEVTVLSLHWDHDRDWPAIRLFEQPYDGFRVLRLNHWRRSIAGHLTGNAPTRSVPWLNCANTRLSAA